MGFSRPAWAQNGEEMGASSPSITKEQCTYRDLLPFMGPVRDQGNIGWCSNNAAADLLSYAFRSELEGRPVSALHYALVAVPSVQTPDKEGVSFDEEVRRLDLIQDPRIGLCTKPLEHNMVMRGESLDNLTEKISRWSQLKNLFSKEIRLPLGRRTFEKKRKELPDSLLASIPPNKLREVFESTNKYNFLQNLAHAFCGDSLVTPKEKKEVKDFSTGNLMAILNGQLDRYNVVGIGINISLFTYSSGPHALVAVGRQWNQKKNVCEYLIRNSWDVECDSYLPEYRAECNQGHFWLSDQALAQPKEKGGLAHLFYIERPHADPPLVIHAPPVYTRMSMGMEGVLYTVDEEGILQWRQHAGWKTGTTHWLFDKAPKQIDVPRQIVRLVPAREPGVVYTVDKDGTMHWVKILGQTYRDRYLLASPHVRTLTQPIEQWSQMTKGQKGLKPMKGWQDFRSIAAGTGGLLYAVTPANTLIQYRHQGYASGDDEWENQGVGKVLGALPGLGMRLLGAEYGILYAVDAAQRLWFLEEKAKKWQRTAVQFPLAQYVLWSGEGLFYTLEPEEGRVWWWRCSARPEQGNSLACMPPVRVGTRWYFDDVTKNRKPPVLPAKGRSG